MGNSTSRRAVGKRPREFPLWIHPSGRWCKKIAGRVFYFGSVAADPDGQAALNEWLRVKDDRLAGREPRPKDAQGLTIGKLCNLFLATLEARIKGGSLAVRAARDYRAVTDRLVAQFGPGRSVEDLRPEDFERLLTTLPNTWNVNSRGLFITMTRAIFNSAHNRDQQIIARPVMFGAAFKPAGQKERRRLRAAKVPRDLTPNELRRLIDVADVPLNAMLFMAINTAFGNSDIAQVPWSAINGEWIAFPRPKTGEPRRAWLWPETRAALADVQRQARKPADPADADLVFLTRDGHPFVRLVGNAWVDTVGETFRRAAKRAGVEGHSFYDARRTFRTVADACLDTPAIDRVMGHVDPSMGAVYRQRIDDARIRRVCEHVREWLYAKDGEL